jgi:hypothetical protein
MRHENASPAIDRADVTVPPGHAWNRWPLIGAVIGVVGLGASIGLGMRDPEQFYFSWLVAFMFFLSIALGGLFFVLTHYVTKASWSVVVRRVAENVMGALPVFVLLFVPVLMGMQELYHWTDADAVAHDHLLEGKASYLNRNFFLVRAAVYFGSWTLLSLWFLRRSVKQDTTGDVPTTLRMIQLSAPALFVFAVTVTFASIDWIMSLDPHWYSTIFGVYYFSGCLVGIFAVMALLAVAMRRAGLTGGAITTEHFHDLGKLLFAFTVFWAYIGFSQYFLIWYGNIPEETTFYLHRSEGSWMTLTIVLAVGHFGLPFLYLMSRNVKRRTGLLAVGSVWMLLMHYLDMYWLVMPVHHHHAVHFGILDVTTLLGIGGVFFAAVAWQMRRRALVPVRDPRLAESLGFENL